MRFKNHQILINNGSTPELKRKRQHVLQILSAALQAADPYKLTTNLIKKNNIITDTHIYRTSSYNRVFLIGFGKASVPMAQAITDHLPIEQGIIISNYHDPSITIPNTRIQLGGHPIPTDQSIEGTKQILALLKKTNSKDLVITLISGGGSALFCYPKIPLTEMQKTTDLLLKSGADITEINIVRKHLSHIKGGQLLKYSSAFLLSLIISDVVNDPIEFIASGPTAPDSTTYVDAKQMLMKYHIWNQVSINIQTTIDHGIAGEIPETIKPENHVFSKVHNIIIGSNKKACSAAANKAKFLGYNPVVASTQITGEARDQGKRIVQAFIQTPNSTNAYITGGETTVQLKGSGKGGRNQELILAITPELSRHGIVAASLATDGIDGSSTAAGAIADNHTQRRALEKQMQVSDYLKNNDSNGFFSSLNDELITQPTGTNVMDIQLLLR